MTRKHIITLLPILLFLGLMVMAMIPLLRGDDPSKIRSVLIDQPVPAFTRAEFSSTDLKNRVILVNIFASWCPPCEVENEMLLKLKTDHAIEIYGINYKDSDLGRRDYLERLGNPYIAITPDPKGELAIAWGSYGVPETFIIDAQGRIRYRHAAPLTQNDIDTIILPLIREIRS
jgi:cytochrome c biogenesis protein CcmG/thiol:disulfide interchange protein DsbE